MGQTIIDGSVKEIVILYNEPQTTNKYSTATWTKPDATKTMKSLQVAFTTAYSGYDVYITHVVNGYTVIAANLNSYEGPGNKVFTLAENLWKNVNSDTLTMRFRRQTDSRQTYSNIRLIVNYENNATASTATALPAVAGDAQTVNITNTDSTVTHAVTWQYGSMSGSTFTGLVTSGAQTFGAATRSPAWAVPAADLAALYAANGSRTTIPGRITVQTYLSGTSIGSTTVEAQLTIPNTADTRPDLSVVLAGIQDSIGTASGEDWLQHHTTLSATATAAGQAGASITGIRWQTPDGGGALTNGSAGTLLINSAGTYPVTVTATDSRGYTATWTDTLDVTACSAPAITALSAERCDDQGEPNDEGAYVTVAAATSVAEIVTAVTWTYAIRRPGSGTDIETGTLTNGEGIIGGSLDIELTYELEITVEDDLGQRAGAAVTIPSAIYTIHRMAGGKGVAFGKVSEQFGVEVNRDWPLYTHGQEILELMVDIAHPVGSVVQTADADWNPNIQWPWSTWVQLTDVFLKASGADDPLDTGGSASASIPAQTISTTGQNVTLTPANLPMYAVYARKSNGTSPNYNGYESDPVSSMIYRAHAVGSNSATASDWRYLISNQAAQAFSIPSQSMSIPGQSISTLPPYLAVNTWMRTE